MLHSTFAVRERHQSRESLHFMAPPRHTRMVTCQSGPSIVITSGRSGRRLGHPASPARDRRGDGRGDAAHLLFADPQFEPRFLDRDLRPRRPADRPGRARADPCRRAALRGEGDDRVLRAATSIQGDVFLLNDPYHGGNHLPDLTAFVPVFEGDGAALLVDQPGASERHRRRDARRLQRRRDRHLAGGHPHHAAEALRPRRGAPRRPAR